jgi:hypothetical protein
MTSEILVVQLRQALATVAEVRGQLYPMQLDRVPGAATAWWKLSPVVDGLDLAIEALDPGPTKVDADEFTKLLISVASGGRVNP